MCDLLPVTLQLCEACGSEGRILVADGVDRMGAPQERDCGQCPYCEGTGGELIATQPVTEAEIMLEEFENA